jgi:hypothetical protein
MKILAIITRPNDNFARELIAHEQPATFDLTAPDPDYDLLLDQIFTADSVQVF